MVLRIIQVGLGRLGLTSYHGMRGWGDLIRESEDWEPVAYVDISEKQIKIAVENYGIPREKCFLSLEEAVKKVEADALIVVVPTKYHTEVALKGLRAGLHTLVEKPFADTLENAKKMVEEAEKRGLKIMVDQNWRFTREVATIKKLLKEKTVGDLGYLNVTVKKAGYTEKTWRWEGEHPWINSGIHWVDNIRNITGLDAVNVSARTWRPSWTWLPGFSCVTAVFEMENGVLATYMQSLVSMGRAINHWSIECSKGEIFWDRRAGVKIHSKKPPQVVEAELVPMELEGRRYILHEFAEAIRQDREPEVSGRDNLKSLAMVHAAVESARTGKLQRIEDYL